MVSKLIISPVNLLQERIVKTMKNLDEDIGIYISLNKPQKSTQEILLKERIKTDKVFFIDCVTSEKINDDVLHIKPTELEMLAYAVKNFIKDIKGPKFLLIDALSTLLIYNEENKVASFVKEITEFADEKEVYIIAFSPITKGEELLNKIFNFFDQVEKDEN